MDDKWRVKTCGLCEGRGITGVVYPGDCRTCKGGGVIWLRPSGHGFAHPGGPALGAPWPEGDYANAEPVRVEVEV